MVDANFAERRNAAPHIPKAWKDISQQVTSLPDQASRQDFVRGLFQAADSRFASAFAEDTDGQSRSVALRDIVHHFMNPNVAALSLLEDSTVDQWLAQYCPTISGDEDEQEQTSGKANPEGDAKRNRQVRDYQRAIFTNTAFWGLMAYRDGTTEWPWAEKRPWFMKRDVVMTMPGMKRRGRGIRSITDDGKTILDLLEECEAKLEVYRQEQKQRAIDGSASPMDTSEDFENPNEPTSHNSIPQQTSGWSPPDVPRLPTGFISGAMLQDWEAGIGPSSPEYSRGTGGLAYDQQSHQSGSLVPLPDQGLAGQPNRSADDSVDLGDEEAEATFDIDDVDSDSDFDAFLERSFLNLST